MTFLAAYQCIESNEDFKYVFFDVYKNNIKIASIGSIGNLDYPTYILQNGLSYANERKKLYRIRHKKNINNKSGNGYWSNQILWM